MNSSLLYNITRKMATKPFSKASFHEPKSDAQGNTKEVLLHEKHGNVVYSGNKSYNRVKV